TTRLLSSIYGLLIHLANGTSAFRRPVLKAADAVPETLTCSLRKKGQLPGISLIECRQILLKALKTSMFLRQTREGGPASIDSASLSVVDQVCSRTGFPVSSTSMKVFLSILIVACFALAL